MSVLAMKVPWGQVSVSLRGAKKDKYIIVVEFEVLILVPSLILKSISSEN